MLTSPTPHKSRSYRAKLALYLGDKAAECMHLLKDGRYRFKISRAERTVLRRTRKISPTEWAPVHFKVPYGPFEGRPFLFEVTPHLWGMLEAYALPFVKKITVQAAAQTTKTTFALVGTAWSAKFEPGPQAWLMPNENDSDEMMEDRIAKSFELSPMLRGLLTGRKEDRSKKKLRLRNSVVRMLWAGSTSRLASRSFKIGVADETNKFNETPSESEGTTLDLFKLRFRTFMQRNMRGAKLLILSSPSTEKEFITIELEKETEAVFVFWSRCPYCDHEQLMDFNQSTFVWPHDEDGRSIDRKTIKSQYLARYKCINPDCRMEWDDDARLLAQQLAMKTGWRLRTKDGSKGEEMLRYLRRERPQSIGFIVPSWISKFVSLSEVAHDYLKTKDKTLSPEERFNAKKHFRNAHCSLPWRIELQAKPVERVKEYIDDRPEGMLPGGEQVAALLAHVDTQDDCFYFSIWAIGYGFQNDMWLVKARQAFSKEEVVEHLWGMEYYDADGQRHVVEHALWDYLGHRTKEVFDFCLQYEGLITPAYGSPRPMTQPFAWTQREFIPGTKQAIPGGGIQAMRMNTKYFKDNISAKLGAPKDSPGSLRIYSTAGDDYCKQLVAEARDEQGNWQQIGSRANHYLDNLVGVMALADWLGIKNREKPEPGGQEDDDGLVAIEMDLNGG